MFCIGPNFILWIILTGEDRLYIGYIIKNDNRLVGPNEVELNKISPEEKWIAHIFAGEPLASFATIRSVYLT